MYVEYLVLQADAEAGPFARVRAQKLNQSWETLQAALDELGQHFRKHKMRLGTIHLDLSDPTGVHHGQVGP